LKSSPKPRLTRVPGASGHTLIETVGIELGHLYPPSGVRVGSCGMSNQSHSAMRGLDAYPHRITPHPSRTPAPPLTAAAAPNPALTAAAAPSRDAAAAPSPRSSASAPR